MDFDVCWDTLQGTNIFPLKVAGMIFLFHRWDMLVLWGEWAAGRAQWWASKLFSVAVHMLRKDEMVPDIVEERVPIYYIYINM